MIDVKLVKIAKIAIIIFAIYFVEQWIYQRIEQGEHDEDYNRNHGTSEEKDEEHQRKKPVEENRPVDSVVREQKPSKSIVKTELVNRAIQYEDLNSHVYLERYKTHVCLIRKNMLTVMMAVLCYINDPVQYVQLFEKDEWTSGLLDTHCSRSILVGELKTSYLNATIDNDFWKEDKQYKHYVIVRHPLKRFVSTFLNFCISPERCNGCYNRLDCFLPFLYGHIRNLSLGENVTRWVGEEHFYPQYWNCYFDRYWPRFRFIYYDRNEAFITKLISTLHEFGVADNVTANVNTVLHSKNAAHATLAQAEQIEREIRDNTILLDYVYKTYYLDFVRFNYTL